MKTVFRISSLLLLVLFAVLLTGTAAFADDSSDLPFMVGDQEVNTTTESLNLAYATPEEISRVIAALPSLPNLHSLILGFAAAEEPLVSWDQIRMIQEARPDLDIDYSFSINGFTFRLSDEVLNLSHLTFTDEGALAVKIASCMPNLRIIDMDSCGVSDEAMAGIRDRFPDVEVIWRVYFGNCYSARTDVENLAVGFHFSLRYCTKLKYLDIGHLYAVRNVTWAAYMPELETLIIAMTRIKDISALANCPKLNYLEFQTSCACDLRPLSGLTELKDLNICYDFALRDIRPLYGLDLDRLWIGCLTPIPSEQIAEYQSLHPNCKINTTTIDPTEEEWRICNDGLAAERYRKLSEEFDYHSFPQCYAYNENDPCFWQRTQY